jgi:hypothetical protein
MKVLPIGSICVQGIFRKRFFRVHDYGLVEIPAPTPLPKEQ